MSVTQMMALTGSLSGVAEAEPGGVTFINNTSTTLDDTLSWTVPAGVSAISVVCVGGGGGSGSALRVPFGAPLLCAACSSPSAS